MAYTPEQQARIDAANARNATYAARDQAKQGALATAANTRAGVTPTAPPTPAAPAAPAPAAPQTGGPMTAAPPSVGTAPPWLQQQNHVATGQVTPYEGSQPVTMTRNDFMDLPALNTDFSGAAKLGADAAYEGATQYFDEDFGRDRAALETQLANQGFARGSEGFDAEMSRMQRGQDTARVQAALAAQGIGHAQSGDLLMRALQSRQALSGERERDADRVFGQSLEVANLGLGARGQSLGAETSRHATAQSAANSNNAVQAQMRQAQLDAEIQRRRLGLDQSSLDFNQMMQLIGGSRSGVNMPNFGPAGALDVTGANQIATSASNAQAQRDAADRAGLYGLGAAALGGIDYAAIARNFGY